MSHTSHPVTHRHLLPLYAATLLLVFHSATVIFINSSFLEQFISTTAVGTIYTIAAALSLFIFLFVSRVLRQVGNYKFSVFLLLLNLCAVVSLAFTTEIQFAIPLFLIHLVTIPLIIFNLDVFMEERIGHNEESTGTKRALLLSLSSVIWAISPLLGSLLVDGTTTTFMYPYLLSAASLLPIIIILLFFFKDFSDPEYKEIDLFSALHTFWKNLSLRSVFIAHFSLQMFFMMMVVYTPIYLTQHIGFSWSEFGIIIFFAQLAYVLFEYPIGIVADRYIGEKEMMGFGFLIIIIATSWMSFITIPDLLAWSIVMFVTRIGASFVEVTTESYFFKQTKGNDAQTISFFRLSRPLSYIVGALLASLALLYVPFNLLFLVFAVIMLPALFYTMNIIDTK